MPPRRIRTLRARHQPLLGTVVEVKIEARSRRRARLADRTIVAQIERLESIFTAFDESSDLCRYRRGESDSLAAEFTAVLTKAREWQECSGGAFNPAAGVLSELWAAGVKASQRPSTAQLGAAVDAIAAHRPGTSAPTAATAATNTNALNLNALNLNAIAKGYIVDQAVDRAMQLRPSATSVTVSAGGDVLHRGTGQAIIGIEDPHRPHDNVAPLMRVSVSNQALATSGSAHRGFEIDGRHYSHVIDPRTGEPVAQIASASVLANDAMSADVLATILTVIGPDEALASPGLFEGTGWAVVDVEGEISRNQLWRNAEAR